MRGREAINSNRSVSRVEEFLRTARALLAEAEKSASEQRLVMKVGSELASALEYETTLRNVARLVVDEFADWCVVDVVDRDGRVRDVAVAHRDARKEEVARTLVRNLPQLPTAPHGVARVLRTMQTEKCTSEVDEPPPLGHYLDAEYPDALRELGARSYICCPLVTREKAISRPVQAGGGGAGHRGSDGGSRKRARPPPRTVATSPGGLLPGNVNAGPELTSVHGGQWWDIRAHPGVSWPLWRA